MADKPVILLVEDSAADVALTLRAFKQHRIANEIVVANDGVEALDFLFGTGAYAARDGRTIADSLAFEGYAVVTAEHGARALDLIKRQPVALILLDMKMPVMDGWAFAREYRAQLLQHAPIVVLTAARSAAEWAAEIEATAYLAKPFELGELLALIDRYALGAGSS